LPLLFVRGPSFAKGYGGQAKLAKSITALACLAQAKGKRAKDYGKSGTTRNPK